MGAEEEEEGAKMGRIVKGTDKQVSSNNAVVTTHNAQTGRQFRIWATYNSDFLICQILLHTTHGFLVLFAFVRTISYPNWFVYVKLYYLQLFIIIAYHLNSNIMLVQYVLCNYI